MSTPAKPSLLVLYSGRISFLTQCLRSVAEQTELPNKITIINDSKNAVPATIKPGRLLRRLRILPSEKAGSGQWVAFQKGVAAMGERACFGLLHDDDVLLPKYLETIAHFGEQRKNFWIATSNIVEMDKLPQKIPVLKTHLPIGPFCSSAELANFYASSFLPFPGTVFCVPQKWILKKLDPSFEIFTDAALLIGLADLFPVYFVQESIYAYRRHAGQESTGFNHRMEDRFHTLLMTKTHGTPWEQSTKAQLSQRRAGRFFQSSWERGTFRHHEFSKDFPRHLAFQAIRNRKWLALKIGVRDLLAWWREKTLFRCAPRMLHGPYGSKEPEVHVIIFSRNRACQLDALIRSMRDQIRIRHRVSVLWKADPGLHEQTYHLLKKEYPQIGWQEEVNFRKDLLNLLSQKTPLVMFCTDDSLFYDRVVDIPWPDDWNQVAAYSLRLGENCRYSHPADEHYRLPPRWRGAGAMVWDWTRAMGDFRYPFSLDAHIFPTARIRKMLAKLSFHNPNTLEDVGSRDPSFSSQKWMISLLTSKYVSIPINRVTKTHKNKTGKDLRTKPRNLAKYYHSGFRINIKKTVSSIPTGPHEIFNISLEIKKHGKIIKL